MTELLTLPEILKAVDGEDIVSSLGLFVQTGIELEATHLELLLQNPSFFCPTGSHETKYAISQSGSEKIPGIVYCPDHLGSVLEQSPSWPRLIVSQQKVYVVDRAISSEIDHAQSE